MDIPLYWKNKKIPKGWTNMWVAAAPSSPEKMYFEVVSGEKAHGNYSVHIHSEDSSGRIAVFPMVANALDYSREYILRVRAKSANVTGTGFYFRVQVGSGYNVNLFPMSKKITGTTDWTVYEIRMEDIVAQAKDESGNFKLEMFAEYMTGDIWIDAIEFVPDYHLELDKTSVKLNAGDTVQLTVTGTPADETVTWTSSNTSVATVNQSGLVTAVGGGMAEIKASTEPEHSVVCTVQIADSALEQSFAAMRAKWVDRLGGGYGRNPDQAGEE